LLSRTRDDIRLWARKHRILHREDRSNASLDPLRNRVRLRVLPEILRQLGASAPEAIRRSMELVRSEAEALAAQAREWLQSAGHRARYVGLPVGLQRRIVIEQLFALGVTPDFAKIEALRSQPGVAVTFDAGARVKRTRTGFLRRCPEPARNHVAAAAAATGVDLDLSARRGRRPFGAIQLRWERRPPPSAEWIRRHKAGVEVFDAASVGDRLHLRHWRPGDRFQPLGFKTPSKLQNLLVNRKVPATRRHHLAIAQHPDGRLVWVQGLPPGHDFRVVARTRQCLVLRWSSAR
jgi:tRNA(Ile)-lysidine synthase